MIPLIAIVIGIFIGIFMPYNLTSDMSPYVAVAILAALDSVFGGILAYMQHKFDIRVFFTGFFANALLAALFTYAGNKLGISLMTAVIVVFGTRMFQNFASMRHIILKIYDERKAKRKEENTQEAS